MNPKMIVSAPADIMLALFAELTQRPSITVQLVTDSTPLKVTMPTTPDNGTPRRAPSPRRGQSSVEYHVTRRGNSPNVTVGPKAARVLDALKRQPMGLGELQAFFASHRQPIKPKTVDGSVHQLKLKGLIDVYERQ
jgi:hypothetical protein